MKTITTRSTYLALILLALALTVSVSASGRGRGQSEDDVVRHQPAPCMDTETFPLVEARTSSEVGEIAVRFRSEDAPDWHEVDLEAQTETLFRGALLRPRPEAARVHYYFVWGRPEQQSREYVVNVLMGGCPGARSAPAEMTEGIRVRRTASGQDELPRGFNAEGVARGPSSRLTLGMVAGGVAGAGVAAIVISGDEIVEPPAPPPDPGAPRACFTPDPVPDISSRDSIRFDASCTTPASVTTFEWNFGDGDTAQGSSVEHVFVPGGIYTVTLTVRDATRSDSVSRVVRVLATPSACFVTNPNPPRISARQSIDFNAECSMGDRDGGPAEVTRYEWDFGDDRPGTEGVFVSRQFPQPDVYGVTLTVTNADGRRHQTTQFVVVVQGSSTTAEAVVAFTSFLELERGTSASIALNGTETLTASAASFERFRLRGRFDENLVEARVATPSSTEGRWQFDFGDTERLEPGSLTVESGQVLALDARRIVFRIGAGEATPIRFRFRLRE